MNNKSEDVRARILEFLRSSSNGKSTGEVMQTLNLSRSQASYHLTMLVLEGKAKRVKKSPRVTLWYPVEGK